MPSDSPRVLELRRRVQADPASIAFAQLAEECRRAGDAAEAVDICRAGLAHHPGYLSARVTLGRALLEVGQLDEAAVELTTVVQAAPTNLPAIRGLAEIHQQRGDMAQALAHYQRALQLAQFDPDLEDSVERLSQVVAPAPVLAPPSPVKVEELFDFDSLLKQLGETATASADEVRYGGPPVVAKTPIDAVDLLQQPADAFADVERDLRERAEQRAAEERAERERTERIAAEERAERERTERIAAEERAEREHAERMAAEERAEREHAERMAAEQRAEREHAERMAAEERAEREHAERVAAEARAAEERAAAQRRAAEQRAAEERAAEERAAEERAAQQAARERAERFAAEEQAARDRAAQQAAAEQAARVQLAARRQAAVVADLEQWLSAIEADRQSRNIA